MAELDFDVGTASRPHPGFLQNGDRHYVEKTETGLVVGVIDGLGHGAPASEAAEVALACLRAHGSNVLEGFYNLCDAKLAGTRGVVAGIAVIDTQADRLEYIGIGNIEVQIYSGDSVDTLVSRHGIVGSGRMPNRRVHSAPFGPGSVMVMFSDGISARFRLGDYYGLVDQPAQFIADVLMRDWSRANDDATVVVVRRRKTDEHS